MQTIPPTTTESKFEILRKFQDTRERLYTILDHIEAFARNQGTSLTKEQRALLFRLSEPMDLATNYIFNVDKKMSDCEGGLVRTILDKENGLDLNQQNVLIAALNGLQQAFKSFADTVATVFGVKTEQVA
jgi:hypothetical protein